MDKMLAALLRGLGIQIAPEALAEIEALLPRIPGIVRKVWDTLNQHFAESESRLTAIEMEVKELNARLFRSTIESTGTATNGSNHSSGSTGSIDQFERKA